MNIAKTKSQISKQLKKTSNHMINASKLLNNSYLLYFILILVIIDMFLFVRVGDVFYIFLYILFGLLVSLQTSNMIIVLAASMILTNIVKYFVIKPNRQEGFSVSMGKQIFEALAPQEQAYFRRLASGEEPPLEDLIDEEKDAVDQILDYLLGEDIVKKSPEKKSDESGAEEEKEEKEEKKEKDAIEELIGFSKDKSPKNIEGLATDTNNLIKTQEALKENMKSLEPMLTQAKSFMADLKKIKGLEKK